MSTHKIVSTALAAGFALITAIPADAKPTAKPKVKTPTVKATTVKPSTTHGPKVTPKVKAQGASATTHGPKSAPKVKAQGTSAHANKGQGKAVKSTQGTSKAQAKTTGSAAKTKTMTTEGKNGSSATADRTSMDGISPTEPAKLSKAQQLLQKNENLRLKMLDRLPPDTKVIPAAAGFKNLGQFVAAVNASHNLGIDFFALKALMVGPESMSLGQAIQQVKGVDATTARRAAGDATAMADLDLDAADTATLTKTKHKGHN